MADLESIVREAMKRAGKLPASGVVNSNESDTPTQDTENNPDEAEKLIIQCVFEVMQMPCFDVKQLAAIRRTLKSVLKSLVKESEYVTIGVIKRYVDPRNRHFVKAILNRTIDVGLVITTQIDDTVIYQINHKHAEDVFKYLERVA